MRLLSYIDTRWYICIYSEPEVKKWPLFSFPFLLAVPSFLFQTHRLCRIFRWRVLEKV